MWPYDDEELAYLNLGKTDFIMDTKPEYIAMVKAGLKKAEVRSWKKPLEGQYVKLRNTETKRFDCIILIDQIWDLDKHFTEQEKEDILDELFVTQDFRNNYDCRYLYTIKEVHNLH